MRKELLSNGQIYHIFTRSIAEYKIFNRPNHFQRMLRLIKYYQSERSMRFSYFIKQAVVKQNGFDTTLDIVSEKEPDIVHLVAYCLMPTHIHLILKQLSDNGISNFMRKILDSYTRYFNIIHKRRGPLWEGKFKNVLIRTDEQLLHLTRYVHLNPVTAFFVDQPEDWVYSSHREYIGNVNRPLCQFKDYLPFEPSTYSKFVKDQISYQQELAKIKKLLLE